MEELSYQVWIKGYDLKGENEIKSNVIFCSKDCFELLFELIELLKGEMRDFERKDKVNKYDTDSLIRIVSNNFSSEDIDEYETAEREISNHLNELKNNIYRYTNSPREITEKLILIRKKRIELWELILDKYKKRKKDFINHFKKNSL